MIDYARLAREARALSPLVTDADLAASVRSLARGRGVTYDGVEGGTLLVRELLAALDVPPRGPEEHRPLAAQALDLAAEPTVGSPSRARVDFTSLFVDHEGEGPLYPPAAPSAERPRARARLLSRWAEHQAALGRAADDDALAARTARTFHGVDETETLALSSRAERLLLPDHGPRHAEHAELDLDEVRAFLHERELDLARVTVAPGRIERLWIEPARRHAVAIALTLDASTRSVFFTVRADDPAPFAGELEARFRTEPYDELLRDVERARLERDEGSLARAIVRMALGAPHHVEPRGLTILSDALRDPSAALKSAALVGAGVVRWLELHDAVVRQKGDDDPGVALLAEQIAPLLDPQIG